MPFGEDFFSFGESSPLVRSGLDSVEPELPLSQGIAGGSGSTIVTLDSRAGLNEEVAQVPEADMGIQAEEEAASPASPVPAPSSTVKTQIKPSLSNSVTPAKSAASRTPRSTRSSVAPKSTGGSTRKRKAAESEPEENGPEVTPAPKRGRPARSASASVSGRLAAKAAKMRTRGRPKSTTPAAKPARKAGRPKKEAATNGEVPEDEFEVEDIVDSAIDADTLEHMYLVKWKDYPDSANTWEPKKSFQGSLDLVRKFDAKKKKEGAEEAAKKAAARKTAATASSSGEQKKAASTKKATAVKAAKKAPGRPGRKRGSRAR